MIRPTLVVFCFCTAQTLHSADLLDLFYEIQEGAITITGCDSGAEGSLVIPEQIEGKPVKKIAHSAFSGTNISDITLPDSIEIIEDGTFSSSRFRKINIGNGVTRIGRGAFSFCDQLEEITFSTNLKRIDESAFEFNLSLKEISLPESLVRLGSGVFRDCTSLESIKISGKLDSIPRYAFEGCGSLKIISFSDSIKSVGESAFAGCINLEDVEISINVTSIGHGAFQGCKSLKNISLPEGLSSIGESAFVGCIKLENVTIPGSVISLGNYAFVACESLTKITIPSGITTFGSGAFSSCYNLKSVTIMDGLTRIGSEAFSGCSTLESITLPDSINFIEDRAFGACKSLKSIKLPENLVSISEGLFYECESLEVIKLPKSLKVINGNAFSMCKSLKIVDLPDNITRIESLTFTACESLEEIKLPSDLEFIGSRAFQGCSSLKSITIPSSVMELQDNLFRNTENLGKINFLPMEMPAIPDSFYENVRPDTVISIPIGSTLYEPMIMDYYVTTVSEEIAERSELSINSIKLNDINRDTTISINFNSELGKSYIIERSSNLQKWQEVETVVGEGSMTDYVQILNDAGSKKVFYRVTEKDQFDSAREQIIAYQDFDNSNNLTLTESYEVTSGNVLEPNSFSHPGDGWGIYSRDSGGPFNIFDESVKAAGNANVYPRDSQGFVDSSKTDKFWGITDTDNDDLRGGHAGVNFTFDISSAEMITKISMEFAGMGRFDSTDYMYVYFRVDGGPFQKIFGTHIGSEALEQTYIMEDGDEFTLSPAMEFYYNGLNGKFERSVLKNKFEEFSTDVSCLDLDLKRIHCKGDELTISVRSRTNDIWRSGGRSNRLKALGFDALKIYGIAKGDDDHNG